MLFPYSPLHSLIPSSRSPVVQCAAAGSALAGGTAVAVAE
jgi:hypothetical protein